MRPTERPKLKARRCATRVGASASGARASTAVGIFSSKVWDMIASGRFPGFGHPWRFAGAFGDDGQRMTGQRCVNFLNGGRFGEGRGVALAGGVQGVRGAAVKDKVDAPANRFLANNVPLLHHEARVGGE